MRKRNIRNSPCTSFAAGDEPERGSDRALARGSNAVAAARAAQVASTRRHDLEMSASLPTNGPAARRTNIAAPRMKPICCEVKALVSKNFGQNGEATPNAAYMAA